MIEVLNSASEALTAVLGVVAAFAATVVVAILKDVALEGLAGETERVRRLVVRLASPAERERLSEQCEEVPSELQSRDCRPARTLLAMATMVWAAASTRRRSVPQTMKVRAEALSARASKVGQRPAVAVLSRPRVAVPTVWALGITLAAAPLFALRHGASGMVVLATLGGLGWALTFIAQFIPDPTWGAKALFYLPGLVWMSPILWAAAVLYAALEPHWLVLSFGREVIAAALIGMVHIWGKVANRIELWRVRFVQELT